MIIVSNCVDVLRDSVTIMYTKDKTYCPACGGGLTPHGWCERKLVVSEETKVFSLRVSYCQKCCRSHRELPDSIIPYNIFFFAYESSYQVIKPAFDFQSVLNIPMTKETNGIYIQHPYFP